MPARPRWLAASITALMAGPRIMVSTVIMAGMVERPAMPITANMPATPVKVLTVTVPAILAATPGTMTTRVGKTLAAITPAI